MNKLPHQTEKMFLFLRAASFIGLCLALLPWLITYCSYAINSDIAFLTLSAGRLLDGQLMSQAYYDTNLPLSIIVQIPAAALAKVSDIPLYYATNIYAFSLLVLSLLATNTLLQHFKELTAEHRVLILGAYLLANTLLPDYDFGQKDQLLGLALFPLTLTQILITRKKHIPASLKYFTLAAGGAFILLKPHYGIIPAALFIHRAITQRRINIVFDPDFLWLFGMAICYFAVLTIFFRDFLTLILPDVLTYYAQDIAIKGMFSGILLMLQASILFFITEIFLKKAPRIISILFLISVLCFIPFTIQGKDWVYHALPAYMFFYSATILLLSHLIASGISSLRKTDKPDILARVTGFILPIMLFFAITARHYTTTPEAHFLTHQDYKNTAFTQKIESCSHELGRPCSFLMPDVIINVSQERSVYTNALHMSRFPSLWFLPRLLYAQQDIAENRETSFTQEELNSAINKYMTFMAEDFRHYRPDLIFMPHFSNIANNGEDFDLRTYMLSHAPDKFAPIWANYELEETIMVDRLEYMHSKLPNETLIRYDIYKKKNNQYRK